MKRKNSCKMLQVTFHNPNTPEETAKMLIKIIAENIANQVIDRKRQTMNTENNRMARRAEK